MFYCLQKLIKGFFLPSSKYLYIPIRKILHRSSNAKFSGNRKNKPPVTSPLDIPKSKDVEMHDQIFVFTGYFAPHALHLI